MDAQRKGRTFIISAPQESRLYIDACPVSLVFSDFLQKPNIFMTNSEVKL